MWLVESVALPNNQPRTPSISSRGHGMACRLKGFGTYYDVCMEQMFEERR